MKYLSLSVALVLILCSNPVIADEKEKEQLYDQLCRGVVRLEHFESVEQEGSTNIIKRNVADGTAFFVRSGKELFIVSARHVVEKPHDLHPRVQCKNRNTGEFEVVCLELPRDKWVFHNNSGDNDTHYVDVAVMKISWIRDRSIKGFRYEPEGSTEHEKNRLPLEDPNPPQPILVFGFPSDLGFKLLEQKPFCRLGVVSMKTGKEFLKLNPTKFVEERCCLIDAPMFGGNSGSPVMNQLRFGDSRLRLLGLVIATNNMLDFGIIEPVSRIREALDLAKDTEKSGKWKLISQP